MRNKYLSAIVVAVSLYLSACTPAPTIENFNNSIISGDVENLEAIHSQGFVGQAENKEAVNNALIVAAKNGKPEVVKFLIDAGYPVEAKDENGNTALSTAASNNKAKALKVLLDAGANVNARDGWEWTPLMEAVNSAKSSLMVSALLAADADVNAAEEDGWTALHLTVNNPDDPDHDLSDIATLLLEAGANKEAKTKRGDTPLALAALNNKPNALKVLLDAGANVNTRDKWQRTPLMAAVNVAKSVSLVRELLAAGADVNAADENGWTALHHTVNNPDDAEHDLADIATLLLEAGANKEAKTKRGRTPLALAALNNKPNTLKLLLDAGANKEAKSKKGRTPLALAALNSNPNILKVLLEAGAEVSARDKWQWTPLMRAGKNAKSPSMLRALLAAGADVGASNESGWTALHYTVSNTSATDHDLADMATLLLEAGVNKEAKTKRGRTPLAIAALYNKPNALKVLLDAGANLEAKTKRGDTPLALAALYNKPNALKVLLDAGAEVNTRNTWQGTPLINSVNGAKSVSLVRALLAAGADVNAAEEDGWTALHYTVNNPNDSDHDLSDIATLLLEAGANKEAKNKTGSTPLAVAAFNNKPNTLKVLLDAGADVNTRAKWQAAPLINAVNGAKSVSLVRALLAAGADVNAAEEDGWTALHHTVNNPDEPDHDLSDIATLLIEAGANKEAKTKKGRTPLAVAALNNKPNTLKVLLDAGADVNTRDKWQQSPLMNAVNGAKSASLVRALLAAGADVNAAEEDGWTALHFTVNNRNEPDHDLSSLAELLLEAGANKDARIESGYSALMIAGINNKPEVARILVDFGVSLDGAHRSSGKSALDYALQNSNKEVINILRSAGAISAIEDAKYPARPSPRAGYVRCNTRCNNGDCYRTYSDGEKVRFQAQRKYNAISGQWEFDPGSC